MSSNLEKETPNSNKIKSYERRGLLDILKRGEMAYIYFGGKNLHAMNKKPTHYAPKFRITQKKPQI